MWLLRMKFLFLLVLSWGLAACRPLDMYNQPRYEPYEHSAFFEDERSARIPPAGTVPRRVDFLVPQIQDPARAQAFPFPIQMEELKRGRQLYEAYCAPCHALTGQGDGMIVQRGFPRPPSLHEQRLVQAPTGHFYTVITQGIGTMPPYASHVRERERWLVIAYIKALQLSQGIKASDLPENLRQRLEEQP